MSNKTNQKQSELSDNDTSLRRSSRNKSKPKDAEVSLDESKDMPLCEPSPLSTRNLRNKYVRKPLSEYGKKSSSKDKKVDTDDEYTKILPQNETEIDTRTIDQRSNSNSPFSHFEGQKLSIIPNAEDENIHSAMSPPIGTCKTSSPVNSTELFDAPTSAIVGPVARVSRYNSQSSTGSHDESYISTRSEKRTRLNKSKTVTQKSVNAGGISETSTRETDRSNLKNISKTSLDLSAARKRHEDIKRLYREHETQEHEWMATFLNSGGIIVAILIIALVMKSLLIQKDSFKDSLIQPQTDLTKTAIKSLKDQFPSQTNSTWKVLASNIQRIQRKKSNQAACIVFVNNKARPINNDEKCIASNVAKEISLLQNKNSINDESKNLTLDSKKFRTDRAGLHSSIETSLSRNSVIVLFDIDQLDGKTAMALHSFCDNDPTDGEDPSMAPFVHTAVLTTIEVNGLDDAMENGDSSQGTESAYSIAVRELTSKWSKDIGIDKAASLISRVALNAVYLEPESPSVISKACPVV